MEIIKTAVIGSGFMGSAHIEALRRVGMVEVHAIASNDMKRARELARAFSIPKVYSTWRDLMLDPEIQAVHNCTPNNLHFEINRDAIRSGKHILSEKPLTINSRESAELLKLIRRKGVINAINFNYRFYPLIQHARQLAASGDLGEIYLIHGHYLQDWLYYDTDYNWRLEEGISGTSRAVADIGSHWCDLVQFITGLRITRVFADLVTFHKTRKKPRQAVETFKGMQKKGAGRADKISVHTEDAANVLLQFENGARGVFTVSQVSAGRKNHFWFEIDGSRKALAWNQEEPNQLWLGHREKGNEIIIKDPSLLDKKARPYAHYPGGHPEGYPDGPKNLFIDFYNFIRSGKNPLKIQPDFPTFADGHWEIKMVEAVLESHRSQKWVDLK